MGKRINKHKEGKNKIKTIIRRIIMLIFLIIIIYVIYGIYKESKVRLEEGEPIYKEEIIENIQEQNKENKVDVNIPIKYSGYKVSASLEIPKIKLKAYVLENYAKEEMEVSPCKYWGPEPNTVRKLLYCRA